MNTLKGYLISAAIVLYIVGIALRLRWGSNRFPLIVYVIGVAVVWTVILGVTWFVGSSAQFRTFALVGSGFVLGMLAMYIAVHVYRS